MATDRRPKVSPQLPATGNMARPATRATARPRPVGVGDVRTMSLAFLVPDAAPANRLLVMAITWSIVLHAVFLAIRFSPIALPKLDRSEAPMEVALVNARTISKPTKADLLAQANLDGGGNTDADHRAKTPLPVVPRDNQGNDLALAAQQVDQLEQQTKEMMTQLRSQQAVAALLPQAVDVPAQVELPSATESMQKTLEAMRLEAQIAKDMDT